MVDCRQSCSFYKNSGDENRARKAPFTGSWTWAGQTYVSLIVAVDSVNWSRAGGPEAGCPCLFCRSYPYVLSNSQWLPPAACRQQIVWNVREFIHIFSIPTISYTNSMFDMEIWSLYNGFGMIQVVGAAGKHRPSDLAGAGGLSRGLQWSACFLVFALLFIL